MRFLRTYIADEITTMAKMTMPDNIKLEFLQDAQARLPRSRTSGTIDILIRKDTGVYNHRRRHLRLNTEELQKQKYRSS